MRRPSASLIVASIAFFVALGGTSYAVSQLPGNSVGTKQLKKDAVTSAKIKDGTIAVSDFSGAALASMKGGTGATGSAGATGATGAQGPPGPSVGGSAADDTGLTLQTSPESVVALGDAASASSSGPVVVTQTSRLQISASMRVYKPTTSATANGIAWCDIRYGVAGSGEWSMTTFSSNANTSLPAAAAGIAVFDTLALEGFAIVTAGRYDVQVRCWRWDMVGIATAEVELANGAINVVAIPT